MKPSPTLPVTVRVPAADHAAMTRMAVARGVTLAELVRSALAALVAPGADPLAAIAEQIETLRLLVEQLPTTARINTGQHRVEHQLRKMGAPAIAPEWSNYWRAYELARASGDPLPAPPATANREG